MKRSLALALVGSVAVALLVAAGPPPGPMTVDLTVLRHKSITNPKLADMPGVANPHVKAVFDEMGALLQTDDGGGDVVCNVAFRQRPRPTGPGMVGIFDGPNTIATAADYKAINCLGGADRGKFNIKVVSTIDYCGGYMPSAVACADTPQQYGGVSILIEERYYLEEGVKLAAVICAHEYGHNRGLPHRSTAANNLMNATVGPNCRVINAGEKALFLIAPTFAMPACPQPAVVAGGGPDAVIELDPTAEVIEMPAMVHEGNPPKPPVKEFVQQLHIHGVPYDVASQYTKDDVKILLEMLQDKDERKHWVNIATTICFAGDETAVAQLIAFAKGGERLDRIDGKYARQDTLDAKKAVLAHLGVIVNKNKEKEASKTAVEFMAQIAQAKPEAVAALTWMPPTPEAAGGEPPPIDDLAIAATWGLAVSGKPEAAKVVKELATQESPRSGKVKAAAAEARKNPVIESGDLKRFFEHKHHR